MKKIYFNGYFTREHINGVPRYCYEIIKRLDVYFKPGEAELVIPRNAVHVPDLKNISICSWNDRGCHREIDNALWSLIVFGPYVNRKNGFCVNLSNWPEWVNQSITCLHDDISLRKYDFNFKISTREKVRFQIRRFFNKIWFYVKIFVKKRTTSIIVTVSEQMKDELSKKYRIPTEKMYVIGNGWEHIESISECNEQMDSRIKKGEYYFYIGNIMPHKNLKWIFEEAKNMPGSLFVISGKLPGKLADVFQKDNKNIIFTGYISDGYMKYLMRNCKALLFPSYIEGFGIPPLEALALGSQAIVADIPVMHEIYGKCVHYIDPEVGTLDLDQILEEETYGRKDILQKYSWLKSADKWFLLIDNLVKPKEE